jgi:prevent-host-death family protein
VFEEIATLAILPTPLIRRLFSRSLLSREGDTFSLKGRREGAKLPLHLAKFLARLRIMATINMHDAKTQLSDLVARAEAGEEIVIARRNKPAVKLVPVRTIDESRNESGGFAEDRQAEFDTRGLREAVEAGREFTIMQNGKAVATVAPTSEKKPRMPGRLAHLRGSLPPDLFDQLLDEDELAAWEGKYSGDGDR